MSRLDQFIDATTLPCTIIGAGVGVAMAWAAYREWEERGRDELGDHIAIFFKMGLIVAGVTGLSLMLGSLVLFLVLIVLAIAGPVFVTGAAVFGLIRAWRWCVDRARKEA